MKSKLGPVRKYFVFIVFFVFVLLALITSSIWYFSQTAAPSANTEPKRFIITRGSSATKIANDLEKGGLVKSALAFKIYTQINGISNVIPPGEFSIPQNLDLEKLVSLLRRGPIELWVTIPEGLRREEIAERVPTQLEMTGEAASVFRQEFLALTSALEGHLFPDTYLFPKEVTAQAVVATLTSTFNTKFPYDGEGELTLSQAVTLASLIEREAVTDDERPVVAGILLNRIEAGWPLQADASVQYALGTTRCKGKVDCDWWQPPSRADLELSSPYNTYTNVGLPPAPVANPGLMSLNAAINPEASDYMFYIHDTEGVIHYAETLDEHNQNVARYLR